MHVKLDTVSLIPKLLVSEVAISQAHILRRWVGMFLPILCSRPSSTEVLRYSGADTLASPI